MTRPDLGDMWALAFDDDTSRLKPEARYAVLEEYRCRRAGHLQAVVLRSAHGRWVAWRSMPGARDVWSQDWLDDVEDIEVTCHCDRRRRVALNEARAMP